MTEPVAVPANRRRPELDGLRGVAILLVMLAHASLILRDTPLVRVLEFGWIGVDLFFVLSGYLITKVLTQTCQRPEYYRRFYIRRWLRIGPLYILFLAVVLSAVVVLRHSPHPATAASEFAQLVTPLPLYLFLLQNLWPASLFSFFDTPFLSATWSLCIEEHFYIAWPVCIRKFSLPILMGLLVALLSSFPFIRIYTTRQLMTQLSFGEVYQIVYRFTPLHLDSIAAGCLLGLWIDNCGDTARVRVLLWAMLAGGGLVAVLTANSHSPNPFAWCFTGLAAAFAGLLGLVLRGWARTILTWKWLGYLGRISYGVYLIHLPVFVLFQSHSLFRRLRLESHLRGAEFGSTLVAIGVTMALAACSWKYLESPLLAMKSRLAP